MGGLKVVAIIGGRCREGGETIKQLRLLVASAHARNRTNAGQIDPAQRASIARINKQTAARIAHDANDKFSADEIDGLDHVFALGNQRLPIRPRRRLRINFDQPIARGVEVGQHKEVGAVAADDVELRFKFIRQREHGSVELGCARVAEIDYAQQVFRGRTTPNRNLEPTSILGRAAADKPLGLIRHRVDEHVTLLRRTEAMVIELLVLELAEGLACAFDDLRCRVTRVEKTRIVVGPGDAGKLHPLDDIAGVFAGLDRAHAKLIPI